MKRVQDLKSISSFPLTTLSVASLSLQNHLRIKGFFISECTLQSGHSSVSFPSKFIADLIHSFLRENPSSGRRDFGLSIGRIRMRSLCIEVEAMNVLANYSKFNIKVPRTKCSRNRSDLLANVKSRRRFQSDDAMRSINIVNMHCGGGLSF